MVLSFACYGSSKYRNTKNEIGFCTRRVCYENSEPRPDLVRLLDQYASDVVSIVFEYDERKLEPNEVLFEPRVQIQ